MDKEKGNQSAWLSVPEWFMGQRLIDWIRLAFDVWKAFRA